MKPCKNGKRHSWTFVRNRIFQSISGSFARVSKRGVYECTCGATKLGDYQITDNEAKAAELLKTPLNWDKHDAHQE